MRAIWIILLCISFLGLRGQRIAKIAFPSGAGNVGQEGIVLRFVLDGPVAGIAGLEDSTRMFVGFLDPVFSSISTPLQQERAETFNVFPNPFSEIIFLRSLLPGQPIKYKLSDLHGRIVLQGKTADINTTIPTHSMHPGVYILTLSDAEGHFAHYKLNKL